MTLTTTTIERRRIVVQGIVQGVGFRPFVYGLAQRCDLGGFVLNDGDGVSIEVEGKLGALEAFEHALSRESPPLARVDHVTIEIVPPCGETVFAITQSQSGTKRRTLLIAPDTATCDDCLHELLDPADRRYHYPFINCTNCGPRFTIVYDVPYDRAKTTMRDFPLCLACQAEYGNPLDRRFHAQPTACPECGPVLDFRFVRLDVGLGLTQSTIHYPPSTIHNAAAALANGAIVAIKGLGGYHLACNAYNIEAVNRLRQRKHREAKPFAVMLPDLATARRLCVVSDDEAALLQSRQRPIVLLQRCADCAIAPGVALAHATLGIMLPYTPLHHLLLDTFATTSSSHQPVALVMTSGNMSDEPIAYCDDDAHERLKTIADGIVSHNRPIHMRCDDSVVRIAAGGVQLFRRSRGYAPEPILLAFACPVPLLACGGHLKNTFCLAKGQQAFVSHHIGDLENMETLTAFREGIEHYKRLFDISPQAVAYDLHPEYLATKYALDLDIPQIGIQHHHAHIASVMAEHGLTKPVIGVAADGSGYGSDGTIWGCEIMRADLRGFERLAHLDYMPLPGGEQAVRQPWRMAAVYLEATYGDTFLNLEIPFVQQLDQVRWRPLTQMIARNVNAPLTSSLGRLFDAVAALLGLCGEVLYEGQAAIELELLAEATDYSYPFAISPSQLGILDVRPLIHAIVEDVQRDVPIAQIAGRFHRSVAMMLAEACQWARERTGLNDVVLSGGVFQNRHLLEQLVSLLEECGFRMYLNRRVPPNDGGLSLGQLAIASQVLKV